MEDSIGEVDADSSEDAIEKVDFASVEDAVEVADVDSVEADSVDADSMDSVDTGVKARDSLLEEDEVGADSVEVDSADADSVVANPVDEVVLIELLVTAIGDAVDDVPAEVVG